MRLNGTHFAFAQREVFVVGHWSLVVGRWQRQRANDYRRFADAQEAVNFRREKLSRRLMEWSYLSHDMG
jgi:hypothetical protein